ncbi:DUF421 domain-containing protein [Bacillus sp. HNG]|uniref:DUF421 domain-containing protein n=1 Tax=Bacillus sp. HNG TaxID=2293325 RepID=UPI000E2FCA3E|nr:YetF domain-containing protein [Bacillus sp. HNG]RFB18860.1 DUF421 domain-containing protein [Bacillus sp. HNG]
MHFFASQDHLTAVEWILRAIVGFVFFIVVARMMGQRTISQVGLLDFVIVLLIGNIIAHPLSDEGLGLKGSMITMTVILILYLIGILLSLRSNRIRKLFIPAPIPLIENGKVLYKNLNKARISIDVLLSELRMDKIEDIQKVALASWEPGGSVSIFLKSEHQPLTPNSFNAPIQPFQYPKTIIKEKKIDQNVLNEIGKNEDWLLQKLQATIKNITLNEILLGTIDENENVRLFLYH